MAYVTSRGTSSAPILARLGEMGRMAGEGYQAWRLYRRTLSELGKLSPRDLDDLGLDRSNLRQAAFEAVYGKAH